MNIPLQMVSEDFFALTKKESFIVRFVLQLWDVCIMQ
jgi:hypothetical protein